MGGAGGAEGPLPIGVLIGPIGVSAAWWLESARRLDDAGYASLWTWDHFVSRGDRRTPVLEAWTTLAAAAAVTGQATLGTFVTNVMNRHPAVLARMAATVSDVAGGRLTVGIGIGGYPGEHEAYGIPFPEPAERARHLEEAVAVLRALWSGGPVTLDGPRYPLRDAYAAPALDPAPRILIGAGTPAGIRLAARIGDGWAAEHDTFDQLLPGYLAALQTAGRARGDQRIVVSFSGGKAGVDALTGSPWVERPRDEIAAWREKGADEVIVTARTSRDIEALLAARERW